MPIYESEELPREELDKLRKKNVCAICGGWLNMFLGEGGLAFMACNDFLRTHHDGGIKSKYAGEEDSNTKTRRFVEMEQKHGTTAMAKVVKYEGVLTLQREHAMEILEAIWPEAPMEERTRAAMLCVSYQLNPLMKHIYLVPFNKGQPNETWATIMSIQAKRLLGSRRAPYGYEEGTPRIMKEEEQVAIFGEYDEDKIWVICKLVDPASGAKSVGYGNWPKKKKQWNKDSRKYVMVDNVPRGEEYGNTKFNMASTRAESQALSRLRPGEMPTAVEVMDEALAEIASKEGVIEGEFKIVDEKDKEAEPAQGVKGVPERIQVDAEETIPEETEPEPETPPAKDESPISPQQLTELDAMMNKTSTNLTSLGKFMNKDKGWNVKKLGDLKCWQFKEIMAAYDKGQEQPPAEKLL